MRALLFAGALATIGGCALVHQRDGDVDGGPRIDTGPVAIDTGPVAIDVGPIVTCEAFWSALSACPASPALAIGEPCGEEGATCGVHCCEPGPPIACSGGRWSPLDRMDDCSGVRCQGPHPCGTGMCAFGRVCVVPAGALGSPAPETCVAPPAPIDTCSAAPPGSIGEDPSACIACTCGMDASGTPIVTIDCRCC